MPMLLPPPTSPAIHSVSELPRSGAVVQARKGLVQVQLIGLREVTAQELQALLDRSADMEKVILALRDREYRRGALAAQLAYAVDGNKVYIWSIDRGVRRVTGSDEFGRYFSDATASRSFDLGAFERSRVLASAQADRVALTVLPRFVDAPGNKVDLALSATPMADAQATALSLEISDHGNRYSGKNLISANLRHARHDGNEYGLAGKASPAWINRNSDEQTDYYELSGAYSRVATWGVFGLSLRSIDFTVSQDPYTFEGSLREVGVESSHVLRAAMDRRALLRLKASVADRRTDLKQSGDEVFAEQYASFELSPSYSQSIDALRVDGVITLLYAHELETHLNSSAADAYYTLRPLLKFEWTQSAVSATSLTAVYQFASDTVAELQQWVLGGPGALSAYEPAALVGDTGYVLRLNQGLKWSGKTGRKLLLDLFIERGMAEAEEDGPAARPRTEATDVGANLQLSWRNRVRLSLGAALPLSDSALPDEARRDVYASMGVTF